MRRAALRTALAGVARTQLRLVLRHLLHWPLTRFDFISCRNTDLRLARTNWSIPVVLDRAARDLGY